jgi:hypothetical protein
MPIEDARQLVVSLQKAIQDFERDAQSLKTLPEKTSK